jgi:hypothetical protein
MTRLARVCPRVHTRRTLAAACSAAALTLASAGAAAAPADPPARAPLWGVTVDKIAHLPTLRASLAALPARPTTRIYFDVHEPPAYYEQAVAELGGVGAVMGELLDSSDEKGISVASFQARTQSYLQTLGAGVSIWEIGNEVNGNWTGRYSEVAAKLTAAEEDVAAAGGRTALTLYANNFGPDHCGDGEGEPTPTQFTEQYVPASVANAVDYVLLSYYPTQCDGIEPSSSQLAAYLQELHGLYPHASLGFGEVGLPHRAHKASLAQAEQIMSWAYSLDPGLPYYIGGYFWWYGAEDALGAHPPLAAALAAAFEDESAALQPPI